MIIDSFLFNNEIDILKLRLELSYQFVNYFIIIESKKTFQNKTKELNFLKNKKLFLKYIDKIIYLTIDEFPKINKEKGFKKKYWGKVNWFYRCYQETKILDGINQIININNIDEKNFKDIKIIFSDCDEIINPEFFKNIDKFNLKKNNLHKFEMYHFNYNLFMKGNNWHGALITTLENILKLLKSSDRALEMARLNHSVPHIKNGGWHLSYFGDNKTRLFKLKSLVDCEPLENKELEKRIKNYIDPRGRSINGPHNMKKYSSSYLEFPKEIIYLQYYISNTFSKIAFDNLCENEIYYRSTFIYYDLFKNKREYFLNILCYDDLNLIKTLKEYFYNSNIVNENNYEKENIIIYDLVILNKINDNIQQINTYMESKIKINNDKYVLIHENSIHPILNDNKINLFNFVSDKNIKEYYIYKRIISK